MKRGALGRDGHDLAVVDSCTLRVSARKAGMAEAMKLSPSPTPDHERALLAGADEHARLVGGHRDERVVAAQVVVGEAHGLDQVALEVVGDQVGHHLGVGLGGEVGALGPELLAQLGPVLDDPVEHDVDALGVVGVRVRVASVTRPWVAQRVWPMPVEPRQVAVRARDRLARGAAGCPRRGRSRSTRR